MAEFIGTFIAYTILAVGLYAFFYILFYGISYTSARYKLEENSRWIHSRLNLIERYRIEKSVGNVVKQFPEQLEMVQLPNLLGWGFGCSLFLVSLPVYIAFMIYDSGVRKSIQYYHDAQDRVFSIYKLFKVGKLNDR